MNRPHLPRPALGLLAIACACGGEPADPGRVTMHRLNNADFDGKPVLDDSLLYFSSEIEDGNTHSHFNLPIAVVGGSGGTLDTGRHLRVAGDPPVANLYLSFLAALGVTPPASFGDDGTGPLPGVLRG